jgi:hypothetical protein
MLGGVISVFVVWWELGPTAEEKRRGPLTFEMAMRRLTAIYLAITLLFFVVAVITGGAAPIVITAFNLGLGLLGFVVARRSGRPKTSR